MSQHLGTRENNIDWIKALHLWGQELGFSRIGVTGVDLSDCEVGLQAWLASGQHGTMHYMEKHGMTRARPAELLAGTLRVITARMDYLPDVPVTKTGEDWRDREQARLNRPNEAVISLYARGRDYHKVIRNRLQLLADRIHKIAQQTGHRAIDATWFERPFTDSAPVLEVELATRAGLGWRGKHTLALSRDAGSMFFLGEIFTNLALPLTPLEEPHCGNCRACIDVCPTQAITAPYRLDARRCISYLTIEHQGPIPVEFRRTMGNRIYGCDDCQTICPWNKFAKRATLSDFEVRPDMQGADLLTLFAWSEEAFLKKTEGSAIRRIGHERWLRNIAVALGNALHAETVSAREKLNIRNALTAQLTHPSELVRDHVQWALQN